MVFSCSNPVHDAPINYEPLPDNPFWQERIHYCKTNFFIWLFLENDPYQSTRWRIRLSQFVGFVVVVYLIVLSELQIRANHILPGEDDMWSFSQVRCRCGGDGFECRWMTSLTSRAVRSCLHLPLSGPSEFLPSGTAILPSLHAILSRTSLPECITIRVP